MTAGTGALKSHKITIGDPTDKNALVATVNSHRAAGIGKGRKLGPIDVHLSAFAEGGVADAVAAAGGEK
jgi:hypothetical protein